MNSIISDIASNVPDNIDSAGEFDLRYINIFCGVYCNLGRGFGDSVSQRNFLAAVALVPHRFENFIGSSLLPGGNTFLCGKRMNTIGRFISKITKRMGSYNFSGGPSHETA